MRLRLLGSPYYSILLAGLLGLSACGSGDSAKGREEQLDPEARDRQGDRSEAVGFFTDGALLNPVALPPESAAHLKIFRLRDRGWATQSLVSTIVRAAETIRREFPEGDRVQVGDMASEDGGPLSMHASHQNGLDADVAYLRSSRIERDPNTLGERGFDEDFVVNKRLTKNFDLKRNWFFFKALVARGSVSRIFVDPEIKRAFCLKSTKLDPSVTDAVRTEVLRRLRPYPEHDDHLHLRIRCPSGNSKCLNQEELSAGSGCDRIDLADFSDHEHSPGGP